MIRMKIGNASGANCWASRAVNQVRKSRFVCTCRCRKGGSTGPEPKPAATITRSNVQLSVSVEICTPPATSRISRTGAFFRPRAVLPGHIDG